MLGDAQVCRARGGGVAVGVKPWWSGAGGDVVAEASVADGFAQRLAQDGVGEGARWCGPAGHLDVRLG